MTTVTYTGPVIDTDLYRKANCEHVLRIKGELYVLRQFSINQVFAMEEAVRAVEDNETEAMKIMMDVTGNHLFPLGSTTPVGAAFVKEEPKDVALFYWNLLTSDKGKQKTGMSPTQIAADAAERAEYTVEVVNVPINPPDASPPVDSSTSEESPSAVSQSIPSAP